DRGSRQPGVPGRALSRWIGFGADRAAEVCGFIATPRPRPETTRQPATRLRRVRAALITQVIVGKGLCASTASKVPCVSEAASLTDAYRRIDGLLAARARDHPRRAEPTWSELIAAIDAVAERLRGET